MIAAQDGDQRSLTELQHRYRGAIEASIRRQLANEDDIREIRQDVLLQVSISLDTLRNPECVGGWMRTISRRLAIKRSIRRDGHYLVEPHTLSVIESPEEVKPLDHLIQEERYEALHEAIGHLKFHHRQVIKWFYFENYSLEKIGKIEHIPVGTVKSRLHAARKILSEKLQYLRTA